MTSIAPEGSLERKLGDLVSRLDGDELESYKLLLSLAVGDLAATNKSVARSASEERALQAALKTIGTIRTPRIIWKGRPSFLTDALFAELQDEGRAARETATRNDFGWMHLGGDAATRAAGLPEMQSFLAEHRAAAGPPKVCMYIYYKQPGDRIDPHLDEEVNPINVLLLLDHSYETSPSHLLLWIDEQWQRILLAPGEVIVFDGAATIHARDPLGEGETVSLLSLAYDRIAD